MFSRILRCRKEMPFSSAWVQWIVMAMMFFFFVFFLMLSSWILYLNCMVNHKLSPNIPLMCDLNVSTFSFSCWGNVSFLFSWLDVTWNFMFNNWFSSQKVGWMTVHFALKHCDTILILCCASLVQTLIV